MIFSDSNVCTTCGGALKNYDHVNRVVRTKNRETKIVSLLRKRCDCCRRIHREITDDILPFKQYEKELIAGVVEHLITSDTIGFENFPCEATMNRWRCEFGSESTEFVFTRRKIYSRIDESSMIF